MRIEELKNKYWNLFNDSATEEARIRKGQKNGDIPLHLASAEMFTVTAQKNMYFDMFLDLKNLEIENKKTQKS